MKWLLNRTQGDFIIWTVILLLSLFSLLAVYSSTGTLAFKFQAGNTEYYLLKHLFLLAFGLLMMYLCHLIDFRYYSRISQILLFISIPLLLLTYAIGVEVNDAKRWITLPGINLTFQTSDLAKLALIMYTARILSKKQDVIKSFKQAFLPAMAPIVLVCMLIAPADLSTAAILFTSCFFLLFIGRINTTYLGLMLLTGAAALGLFILIASVSAADSRVGTWKSRVENFVNDKEGSYQNQQAKIAIASGGVLGKGPGNSSQRNFLPNSFSDFIYAIILEEYGLLGGFIVMGLYLILLFRTIRIVLMSQMAFGALLAFGLSLSLVFQAFINMAVAVHLLPVTGLTLPLISMGGTSLWFTSISLGIILSVSRYAEQPELIKEKEEIPQTGNIIKPA